MCHTLALILVGSEDHEIVIIIHQVMINTREKSENCCYPLFRAHSNTGVSRKLNRYFTVHLIN